MLLVYKENGELVDKVFASQEELTEFLDKLQPEDVVAVKSNKVSSDC